MATTTTMTLTEVCDELVALQRQRTIVIKSRIMAVNRLTALVAGSSGYSSGMSEADRRKAFTDAGVLIKKIRSDEELDHPIRWLVESTMIGVEAFEKQQTGFEKQMVKLSNFLPVLGWVKSPALRGFGTLQLTSIIGECGNLLNYSTVGRMWKRMGCAPHTYNGTTLMGATWRVGREGGKLPAEEWERFGYSPRRRSISYLVGEGIVKQNGEGPYRTIYDLKKKDGKERHPDWSDKRAHLHGMLLATKALYRDLWREWRGIPARGLNPPDPEPEENE